MKYIKTYNQLNENDSLKGTPFEGTKGDDRYNLLYDFSRFLVNYYNFPDITDDIILDYRGMNFYDVIKGKSLEEQLKDFGSYLHSEWNYPDINEYPEAVSEFIKH